PTFRPEPAVLDTAVPAHGWARVTYRLLPTERGNSAFGTAPVAAPGSPGLAGRDRPTPPGGGGQVSPNRSRWPAHGALGRPPPGPAATGPAGCGGPVGSLATIATIPRMTTTGT